LANAITLSDLSCDCQLIIDVVSPIFTATVLISIFFSLLKSSRGRYCPSIY
jgi:hypothetical protein